MKPTLLFVAASLLNSLGMAQTHRYTLTDLGPVGPGGQPFFITSNSLISGAAQASDGTEHAVIWYKGRQMDIGTLGLSGSNSFGFGVNEKGQVVGQAQTWTTDESHEDFCGFQALGLPSSGTTCLPFLWQNGSMTPLPTLGGFNGAANMINSAGDVAGISENSTLDLDCPAPQKFQFKPVVWQRGQPQELPTFGDPEGIALAINASGLLVGASGNCSTFNPQLLFALSPRHALLWQDGKAVDLGNLGGNNQSGEGFGNVALNLNNKGQVVGASDLPGDATSHAFLWTQPTGMKDLGTLEGDIISSAININDAGDVVGVSIDANFNPRAVIVQNGTMTDLNALVPSGTPLFLLLACSINAGGEIIGLAVDNAGEPHGYLLVPANGASGNGSAPAVSQNVAKPPALSDNARRLVQRWVHLGPKQ
jgi:probable HAF family extracellular repeat protein